MTMDTVVAIAIALALWPVSFYARRWRGPWPGVLVVLLGLFFLASAFWRPSHRYSSLFFALFAFVFAFRAVTGRLPGKRPLKNT